MFGLFKRGLRGSDAKPSLDAVRFDTTGYEFYREMEPGRLRVWYTPEGDGLGVYFYPLPPDIPSGAVSVEELTTYYRKLLGGSGARQVETRVGVAGGCPAIRTIVSVPQEPSGRACLGSLTLPFRDFSFVLKCQCLERGPTGIKESILLDRSWGANEPEAEGGLPLGWGPDAPRYDAEFPDHPVARARRVLEHVQKSFEVTAEVRKLPGFALPPQI